MPSSPHPVLSASLAESLKDVGQLVTQRKRLFVKRSDIQPPLEKVIEQLAGLRSADIARAEKEICDAGGLDYRWTRGAGSGWQQPQRAHAAGQLKLSPDLAYLFIFHRDGYLREAALRSLERPMPGAFFATAIAWRMNDWVQQVRDAATACAARTFAISSPEVLADSAWALFDRQNTWSRWGTDRDILREIIIRPDVTHLLLEQIISSGSGPAPRLLRQILRGPALDEHLHRIARESTQPSVRAVAAQTLLEGHAAWIVGWQRRWIDKTYGISERVPKYQKRPLQHAPPRSELIDMLLADKSAMVRRVALDGAIKFALDTDKARAWGEAALRDRSASVRERGEYIVGKTSATTQ